MSAVEENNDQCRARNIMEAVKNRIINVILTCYDASHMALQYVVVYRRYTFIFSQMVL